MNYFRKYSFLLLIVLGIHVTPHDAYTHAYPVIVDHDGGIDDFLSLALVTSNPSIQVDAVTICPADSWPGTAVDISRSLLRFLRASRLSLHLGTDEGKNPFPAPWRNDSYKMVTMPQYLPQTNLKNDPYYSPIPAKDKLIYLLSGSQQYDILATGPLSNIAQVLTEHPHLAKNIHQVYFMGGAFQVQGNVNFPEKPNVAEWNVYNQPQAVNTLLQLGVPLLFVPLDATNQAPVTKQFLGRLKAQNYPLSQLIYQSLKVISPQVEHPDYQSRYFFWDVLTAAALIDPQVIKTKPIRVKVITEGPNEGKTQLDEHGYFARMAYQVDQKRLEELILKGFQH